MTDVKMVWIVPVSPDLPDYVALMAPGLPADRATKPLPQGQHIRVPLNLYTKSLRKAAAAPGDEEAARATNCKLPVSPRKSQETKPAPRGTKGDA